MAHAKALFAGLLGLVGLVLWRRSPAPAPAPAPATSGDWGGTVDIDSYDLQEVQQPDPAFDFSMLAQNISEALSNTITPDYMNADMANKNEQAFLSVIRYAEGTAGTNGYRTLFGGGLFDNGFVDHPRIAKQFTNGAGNKLWTSAAGAYQFMAISPIPSTTSSTKVNTWDRCKAALNLPDFSPASQDKAALYLIDGAGALSDVRAGRFQTAINKVRKIWASMPGAGYAQPEKSLDALVAVYQNAGGAFS